MKAEEEFTFQVHGATYTLFMFIEGDDGYWEEFYQQSIINTRFQLLIVEDQMTLRGPFSDIKMLRRKEESDGVTLYNVLFAMYNFRATLIALILTGYFLYTADPKMLRSLTESPAMAT